MRQIIVEPERLEDTASKVENYQKDYDKVYKTLYDKIDSASKSWDSKDNLMFTNKLKEFEDDFRQISILLRQYAEFLRNSARAYRETQDTLYREAAKLKGAK